jgi:hypothetical protein
VELLRATWRALPVNEQKLALALAQHPRRLRDANVLRQVGLKPGSVKRALDGLLARGDVIAAPDDLPRLTDPLLELWLQRLGDGSGPR